MHKLLCKILLLLLIVTAHAQPPGDEDAKEIFNDAEYYLLYDDFERALEKYLLLENDTNANINYKIGFCYLNMPGKQEKAIPYMEKAKRKISDDYHEGSYKETNAPIEAFAYLGDACRSNMEFDKAIEAYKKYKELLDVKKDIYYIEETERHIESCQQAKEIVKAKVNVNFDNLGPTVNSQFSEYNPVISANGKMLVFTTKRRPKFDKDEAGDYYEEIFYSQRDNGDWSEPVNITNQVEADGYCSSVGLSHDGTMLFIYKFDGIGNLFYSNFEGTRWSPMEKFHKPINTRAWESNACLSPDGKTIYFTSSRKDALGAFDIYKSTLDEKGKWGDAINLGSTVNTIYNEATPYICQDGKTLYFASQGHINLGGFDIFYTKMKDDGTWEKPKNLGFPANTPDDNLFYSPIDLGRNFYSFAARNDGFGKEDIYRVKISKPDDEPEFMVKGMVASKDGTPLMDDNISLTIIRVDAGEALVIDTLDVLDIDPETGTYSCKVNPGNYQFAFKSTAYRNKMEQFYLPDVYTKSEYPLETILEPKEIAIADRNKTPGEDDDSGDGDSGDGSGEEHTDAASTGGTFVVNSILFNYGEHKVNSPSEQKKLDDLVTVLKANPSAKLEIIGHTDSKSSSGFNKNLSEKRARYVYRYLAKKGIDKNRLYTKGAGETQLLALDRNRDNTYNEQGMKYNRRVDFNIPGVANPNIRIKQVDVPEHLRYRDVASSGSGQGNYSSAAEENKTYTIQIMALKNPRPASYFKEFPDVRHYIGDDGLHRYIIGTYQGKTAALEKLEEVRKMGYNDAFIFNIARYQNYREVND